MESLPMPAANVNNETRNINILETFDQWIGVKEVSLYKSASHGIFAKHLLDLHEVYCNQCAISVERTLKSDYNKNDPKRNLDFIMKEHIVETDYRNVDNSTEYSNVSVPSSAILLPTFSNSDGKSIFSNSNLEEHTGKVDMKLIQNQASLISEVDNEEHSLLRSILIMPQTYRETNCVPLTTYNSFRGVNTSELRNAFEEIVEENNNTGRSSESQDCSIFTLETCVAEEKSSLECNVKYRNDNDRKKRTLLNCAIKSPYLYQALTSNLPNTYQISQPYCVEQQEEKNLASLRLQLPKWPVESKLLTDSGSLQPDFELYCQHEASSKESLNLRPRVWICGQCGKTINHKGNLKIHFKRNHLPKNNACSFQGCTRKFAVFKDLQLHEKTVHLDMKPGKNIPCSYQGCSRTFRFRRSLKQHLLIHTGERPFL